MRLFVGVWPPEEVAGAIAALPRPAHPALRWSTPDQWHVTLRFLGEVADDDVGDVVGAVRGAASACEPVTARVGPVTVRLGRSLLVAPVEGLDDLAAAVVAATSDKGVPPPDRPFTGHLTVARGRGRRAVPAALAGHDVSGWWTVGEVAVVRSELRSEGARYHDVAVVPLGAGAGDP